jgi:hypothetical protein
MKPGIKSSKIIHEKTKIPLSTIYDIKKKKRIESEFSVERKTGSEARGKLSSDKK